MPIETDSQGRLYLSSGLRKRYGERFHVVEYDDRIELVPIADDPLQAVRDATGGALEGRSVDQLRAEALESAKREAVEDVGE